MKKVFIGLATILMAQSEFAQIYFGRVRVNSMNYQTTYITNNTSSDLRYSNHFVSGMYFYANHNCYGTLKPNQSCSFQVQYWPSSIGYHSAYIYMTFNNPETHQSYTKTMNAWGEAVP